MPYAKNGDVKIYYEIEGSGSPLVLQHGLTGSLEEWRESGFIEKLENEYQLVLVDALGHGKSDKPHDSKYYGFYNSAKDVIAVLDDLNINTAHYFGYSMGGMIGLHLARFFPERISSMIIGGGGLAIDPGAGNQLWQALEGGPDALVSFIELSGPLSPERKARELANDFEALLSRMSAPPTPNDDLSDTLAHMPMPLLVFVGEEDQFFSYKELEKSYEKVADLTFFTLPGLDHMQAERRSDLIVPHVKEFLARITN